MKQKSTSSINSSKKKPTRTLAKLSSSAEAKEFLVSLANLRDDRDGLTQLRRRFPDVMEAVSRTVYAKYRPGRPEVYEPGSPEHDEIARKSWLLPLGDTLRAIWRAPDIWTKKWGLFRISQDFFLQGDPDLIRLPSANGSDFMLSWKPPTRTERFLLELMRWADLLRYCGNPECPAPYFIATKCSQKYCHTECSKPSQREFKRRWWKENGRRARSAKRK
jgi:hypothetical protein